ncbi:MAG: hypothetical protein ACJAWW_002499 [Sulfurimonas sp.]|jgi:hypothetical protein
MYLEEKIDFLISEHKRLVKMVELFLPDLETEKGVIHFLEITKNTFNNYVRDGVFVEGTHFVKVARTRIFIPDEIIKLKKIGIKGKRKSSNKQDKLDAVSLQLGIIPMCRSAIKR